MTTNQEGRQAAIRDSTSTAYGVAADWHALFDDAGISDGTFNERLLAWINAQLGTSHSNLLGAMLAYANDAGFNAWSSISTLVLGGASTLLSGEADGLAFDFTDSSARIKDTSTPANRYSSTGIVSNGSLVGPSGKLTYTSPSNKLTLQSDGYYKYQAHNLCLYSEDSTNWTASNVSFTAGQTDPQGGTSAVLMTGTGGAVVHRLQRALSAIPATGTPIVFRVWLKAGTANYAQIIEPGSSTYYANFDLSSGAAGTAGTQTTASVIESIGDWHLCEARFSGTNSYASGGFYVYIAPSASATYSQAAVDGTTIYVHRLHAYRYPANTDYIRTTDAAKYSLPLEYDTSGTCLGLLVEEARTNLCLRSNNLSNAAWATVASGDVKTGSAAVGPFGATDMTSLTEGTATDRHIIANTSPMSTTAAATYTVSAFIRKGSRDYVTVGVVASPTNFYCVTFNATTGAQTQSNVGSLSGTVASYGAADCGGGLLRLHVTGSHNGSASYAYVSGATSGTPTIGTLGAESYLGVASTIAFYATQVQLEAGSFPTSPILTYGAAATRAADNISIATSAFPVGSSVGSLYAYFDLPTSNVTAGANRFFNLHGTSASTNRIADVYAQSTSLVRVYGSADVTALDASTLVDGLNKVAVAYAVNDYASCVNNGTVAADTTATAAPAHTPVALELAAYSAGANALNGHLKALSYVPRRKSDPELQTETA